MKSKLILFGAGGHCSSVIDSLNIEEFEEIVILDNHLKEGEIFNGIKVYGDDSKIEELHHSGYKKAFITVGSVGDTMVRRKISKKISKYKFQYINVIDKSAVISPSVSLNQGIFIGKKCIINSNVTIGKHCIVNSGSIVEHGSSLGEYSHIAPGAVILGECKIGNDTHIGANASVKQSIHIGSNVIIGMGSVVLHDVFDCEKVYGII